MSLYWRDAIWEVDDLLNKELAEWSHSKSCGQCGSMSKWRSVISGVPQGTCTIQHIIFVSDMDSGTAPTLSKFVYDV